MLKDLLMTEAQNIDAEVALDSIFESVELSPEVKAKFSTVFEATVKQHAVNLAEAHIEKIAALAEEKLEDAKEEAEEKAEKKIAESAGKFLDHVAKEWLNENKLAVDRGIKADLFESVVAGMKDLFVEHNIVVPEDAVDIVAELQEELQEQKDETSRLFEEVKSREAYEKYMKREIELKESTRELTESQKEKVHSLVEGLEYSEEFATKVNSIVEMVQSSSVVVENTDINNIDNNADGLNFIVEEVNEPEQKEPNSLMAQYAAAAARIS